MKGQGSLEYLIIIVAILVIAATVVLFAGGYFNKTVGARTVATCKVAAADCASKAVTTRSPACTSCETACKYADGKELYPGAIGDCKAGKVRRISDTGKINVVEVYPCGPVLQQITEKFGQNMFDVKSMSIEEFNEGPYLEPYDIVAFGFADCFGNKNLSEYMEKEVAKVVNEGGAYLITHDTVCYNPTFADLVGLIGFDCSGKGYGAKGKYTSARKVRDGEITQKPYVMPAVLQTQETHNSNQSITTATVWYNQTVTHPDTGTYTAIHLTTDTPGMGRVAFIQSGHGAYGCSCSPKSTPMSDDEQKLLINVLYWLAY